MKTLWRLAPFLLIAVLSGCAKDEEGDGPFVGLAKICKGTRTVTYSSTFGLGTLTLECVETPEQYKEKK